MLDIFQVAGNQVIHTDDMIALADEPVAQMRPKETGCSGN
jgi:hypothetical protein